MEQKWLMILRDFLVLDKILTCEPDAHIDSIGDSQRLLLLI